MKRAVILHLCTIIVMAVCLFLSGWYIAKLSSPSDAALEAGTTVDITEETPENEKPDSISVAVYPYVANMELFKQVLTDMWAEMEPDIELDFVEWDCYHDPYPNNIDVITYDALFTSHLAESGFIQPLEIDSVDNTYGILSFAMDGAHHNNDLYGLPFLVCSSFLIHRTDDEAMAKVENFAELCKEMATRKAADPTDGLQIGYTDEVPYFYLDALIDYTGIYTTYEESPIVSPPDTTIHNRLLEIKSAAVTVPQDFVEENFRIRFAQGEGSACYAYSEALYVMKDIVDELTIRPISFFEEENIQMYYADIASLCSIVTDPVEKEYCTKLINLMASEAFQAELCYGTGDVQYMLPAREQVYLTAMEEYPIYGALHELATDDNNRIFRFGTDVFEYIRTACNTLS